MQLPPFVLTEDPINLKGQILIMQTQPPYLIGQVWKFDHFSKRAAWAAQQSTKNFSQAEIRGYNIIIQYIGSFIPGAGTIDGNDVDQIMCDMGAYYYDARIAPSMPRFKQYLKQ